MENSKLTREEALKRWKIAKENKRKLVEKLEVLAYKSYKERTGTEPQIIESW